MPDLQTPHYLIDLARLRVNMERIQTLRQQSGAKCLLALKCFATWSVFDVMRPFMDGTTSSSLYELRLGREKFGGETHAYSVAWADHEIDEAVGHADKIIFNSLGQLDRFADRAAGIARDGDFIVTLSCGDVYRIIPQVVSALERPAGSPQPAASSRPRE